MKRSSCNGQRLTEDELAIIEREEHATCPDCQEGKLYEGPSGGICVNIRCGNKQCGSSFNYMGQRIYERISNPQPAKPPETTSLGIYR